MYLPRSVKMPTHGGKEITLLNLATHTAGFPHDPDNMAGADVKEQFETYMVEKMYGYLSRYKLSRDPGTEYEYSNLGMALLGHVLTLKAGTNFESLLVNRICRPLQMDSTRIMPSPEMRSRLAMGHKDSGKLSPPWKLEAYAPAGAVHSTANDLLKYVSAQAGLMPSSLTPAMEKTHVIRYQDSHVIQARQIRITSAIRRCPGWLEEALNRREWDCSDTRVAPAVIMRGWVSTKSSGEASWY